MIIMTSITAISSYVNGILHCLWIWNAFIIPCYFSRWGFSVMDENLKDLGFNDLRSESDKANRGRIRTWKKECVYVRWRWRDRRFIGESSQLSIMHNISCLQVASALIWERVHNAVPLYQLQLFSITGLLSEVARHVGWTFICGVDKSWKEQKLCPLVPWSPWPPSPLRGPVTSPTLIVGTCPKIIFFYLLHQIHLPHCKHGDIFTYIKLPSLFLNVTQIYDKPKLILLIYDLKEF